MTARELGMGEEEGIALRVQARALRAEGRFAEAVMLLEHSMTRLVETNRYEYAVSKLEMGICLERLNDETLAQATMHEARRELSTFGAVEADRRFGFAS